MVHLKNVYLLNVSWYDISLLLNREISNQLSCNQSEHRGSFQPLRVNPLVTKTLETFLPFGCGPGNSLLSGFFEKFCRSARSCTRLGPRTLTFRLNSFKTGSVKMSLMFDQLSQKCLTYTEQNKLRDELRIQGGNILEKVRFYCRYAFLAWLNGLTVWLQPNQANVSQRSHRTADVRRGTSDGSSLEWNCRNQCAEENRVMVKSREDCEKCDEETLAGCVGAEILVYWFTRWERGGGWRKKVKRNKTQQIKVRWWIQIERLGYNSVSTLHKHWPMNITS